MNTDEGQMRAALVMREASENNLRAADMIQEAINRLVPVLVNGYGNPIEQLTEQLTKLNPVNEKQT